MQNTQGKQLTVLILAAGYGSRMGPFSRMVNKSLIPYNNKPIISHIMDKFDAKTTKFVIACGHMGQQIKDYVSHVHSDKTVIYVDIKDYAEGTGPATTIQKCADHIRGGFMWISCDTLFEFDYVDKLDHNWIGVFPVDSSIAQDYCWVEREAEVIKHVHNKESSKTAVDAFIGLMYAKDDEYLDNLLQRSAKETYEGFAGLELTAHSIYKWKDFGTYEKWEELNSEFTDVSFPKPNELFYHDNGKVIKFWTNADQAMLRLSRARVNLACMPTQMQVAGHFLIHDFAPGDIIYNQATPEIFHKMLAWCEDKLWAPATYTDDRSPSCMKFYYDKTMERLAQFRIKYNEWSEPRIVNDVEVRNIDEYLEDVDWDKLFNVYEWRFVHGDLHFDNTIYDPITEKFTAIDWRTDFAGGHYGDLYYDLAKMLGGLWLSYKEVKLERFEYVESGDTVTINVPSIENAQEYEDILHDWVTKNGLDWLKVKLLVPIIYLNMSPLHEPPFDKFLIALAQLHFSKAIQDV